MSNIQRNIAVNDITDKKNKQPIVMLTAYDALFARLFDDYADIILVGDSLNMSFNAQKDTLNLSIEAMKYHVKAVRAGLKRALLVADMPFGSYFNENSALKNAAKFIKAGADAVKLEGGERIAPLIARLTSEGIAVMGHVGLRPQQVRFEGGYKIKGRGGDAENLIQDALAIEQAGAFSAVIEGTVSSVAAKIARSVQIPIIGIGAGAEVDGQVLVWSDMLGFFEEFRPKFAKRYLEGAKLVREAVQIYANEVKMRKFPSAEFEYEE